MIHINGRIFTHNDSGGTAELFELDSAGNLVRTVTITGATNYDWEDITQDDTYIYIADIGNNTQLRSSSLNSLVIYKILKADVLNNTSASSEQIFISYADEIPAGSGVPDPWYLNTVYDAESLFTYNGNLYILTKNYKDGVTHVYKTSTIPGTYVLALKDTHTFPFLISGADANEATNTIAFIGYDSVAVSEQYLYLLYDFVGDDFFSGTIHEISITNAPTAFRQIEGVTFKDNSTLYISSEEFSQELLGTAPSGLFTVNITE